MGSERKSVVLRKYPLQICLIPPVTGAYYFIYLEPGLGWYSFLYKFVIVELAFDRKRLQVYDFINWLWHALNDLDDPQYICWKRLFPPLGKHKLLCYPYQISHFKFNSSWRDFLPVSIHPLPDRVNVWEANFACWHAYCRMDRVVICQKFICDVQVTVCHIL